MTVNSKRTYCAMNPVPTPMDPSVDPPTLRTVTFLAGVTSLAQHHNFPCMFIYLSSAA